MEAEQDDQDTFVKWKKAAYILCFYGFFIHFLPSEPYFFQFMISDYHNLSDTEVINEVLPVWSYSYLAFLLPVFLLTDILRYKPVIVFQGIGWVSCYLLLIFGNGVSQMQLMEVFYSTGTAAEVAYNSYIYSVIPQTHYQQYTSYIRGILLVSASASSILAQLLVSFCSIDYVVLNIISASSCSIAFLLSIMLPTPPTSVFFKKKRRTDKLEEKVTENLSFNDKAPVLNEVGTSFLSENTNHCINVPDSINWKDGLKQMWMEVKAAYSDSEVLLWSAWFALSNCGWISVVNYIQSLWEAIEPGNELNGVIVTISTVLGAVGAFAVKFVDLKNQKRNSIWIGISSLLMSASLLLIHFINNIWCSYISYIVFIFLYYYVITIIQYQFSIKLHSDVFALIFGVNTFVALLLNTILTIILIEVCQLPVQVQFIVYGSYFGVIALVYVCYGIIKQSNYSEDTKSIINST